MLFASRSWTLPSSYDEAVKWLELHGGIQIVTHDEKEDAIVVVVGVHGRSAEVRARSAEKAHVEEALVAAVQRVAQKL